LFIYKKHFLWYKFCSVLYVRNIPMPDKLAGLIVDQFGGEIEVWIVENGTHVVLSENDAQLGDFPLGSPCQSDPLQVTAQRVAKGEAKRLTVFEERVAVDDPDDPVLIDTSDTFKTLRRWTGDGKVH
jgi:hypothetical protein